MSKINPINSFTGYKNFSDITNTPASNMIAGSQNIFMPDGDKFEPRAGMDFFGADGSSVVLGNNVEWSAPGIIHSSYDDFVNKAGFTVPIRVYYSGNNVPRDIVEVWAPIYSGGVITNQSKWYSIVESTQNVRSEHEYYWAEWFDSQPNAQQPILVFTTGDTFIYSWTGGFAPIISKTANTLTTDRNWSEYGFNLDNGGQLITINGNTYTVTTTFDSPTITVVENTFFVNVDNLAFQVILSTSKAVTPPAQQTVFDVCATINNQVYYADWKQRNVYISWNRNQDATTVITDSAILADLNYSGTYNGTTTQVINVKIDGVVNRPETYKTVVGAGLDDATFSYSQQPNPRLNILVVIDAAGTPDSFVAFINGAGPGPSTPITGGSQQIGTTGVFINFSNTTGHTVNSGWGISIGGEDTFSYTINGLLIASGIPLTTGFNNSGVNYLFLYPNGHSLGDNWTITNSPQIEYGWTNFTYDNPNRLPGQGYTLLLDSNGWAMIPQEDKMYIIDAAGRYYTSTTQLSSDLRTETVVIERLKSEPQNKPIYPYLLKYIKNQISIVSQDKTFDVLGRQKLMELPQMRSISDEVRIDFETADWENSNILYYKRKLYFCLPRDGKIFVYDEYKKYWQSPMVFGRRISRLAIIDNKLIGHSYELPESYELFVGYDDLGLYPIESRAVFPYLSFGERYGEKQLTAIGFEGYIYGNPQIKWRINGGVGGCNDVVEGIIAPENTPSGLCVPRDQASLGKSSLGFHGLGNSPVDVIPHFHYIKTFDDIRFYERNIEIECSSLNQRWSIVSLGTNEASAFISNESITDRN